MIIQFQYSGALISKWLLTDLRDEVENTILALTELPLIRKYIVKKKKRSGREIKILLMLSLVQTLQHACLMLQSLILESPTQRAPRVLEIKNNPSGLIIQLQKS
jgi:hypothetical protein